MSHHVKNAGAFYAYIVNGLGRPMGVVSAFTAIVGYGALQLALLLMMGFFLSQALQDYFNVHLSWWVSALITCAIIQYAGFKNIEVGGRILGTLMVGEILVMLIFDIAVVGHGGGPQGLSFASFAPRTVMGPGFGAAVGSSSPTTPDSKRLRFTRKKREIQHGQFRERPTPQFLSSPRSTRSRPGL